MRADVRLRAVGVFQKANFAGQRLLKIKNLSASYRRDTEKSNAKTGGHRGDAGHGGEPSFISRELRERIQGRYHSRIDRPTRSWGGSPSAHFGTPKIFHVLTLTAFQPSEGWTESTGRMRGKASPASAG